MEIRDAIESDHAALSAFRCARLGAVFDLEVEELCQDALAWRAADPSRRVLVLFEDDELVSVAGYGELPPDHRGKRFWFYFLGVASDYQGRGAGGGMGIGGLGFEAVIERIVSDSPVQLGWYIHVDNQKSQRMCSKLELTDWWVDPAAPHFRVYETWV